MLSHYAKVALRSIGRERLYVGINLLGLSLAMACALILALYLASELTYDRHNVDHERIFRAVNEITTNGQTDRFALTSRSLAPLVARHYPELSEFARVRNLAIERTVFRHEATERYWDDVRIADPEIFTVFTHTEVYGDLETALDEPSAIAISRSFSEYYFGETNPVGETISTDTFTYRVAAVFEDLPRNSHLRYSALISMKRLAAFGMSDEAASPRQLFNVEVYTYFKAPKNWGVEEVEKALNEYYETNAGIIGEQIDTDVNYIAQPLADVHFESGYKFDLPTGNIFYVYGFIGVGIFVVLVACINYTNLATARATRRAKEIGMRKVLGASKRQLIGQFLGESIASSVLALLLGLLLVVLIDRLTPINSFFQKDSLIDALSHPGFLLGAGVGGLIVGLLAGIYPAFYLSAVRPITALTSRLRQGVSKFSLREALVLFQFFIGIGVVACTLIMWNQMEYIADKPLGFQEENRMAVRLRGVDVLKKIPVIKTELLRNANVIGVTQSSFVPGQEVPVNLVSVENEQGSAELVTISRMFTGEEFLDVMGVQITAGRDFSKRLLTDVGDSVIVNEAMVRKMGWAEPLGKSVQGGNGRVVGVVRDFHFDSLHQPVAPLMIQHFPENWLANVPPLQRTLVSRSLIVSVRGDNIADTIGFVEGVISTFDPEHPFEYSFLDSLLDDLYATDRNLIGLASLFSGVCIFIACVGLFGLAALSVEQRTREIATRKVLGAALWEIILLLAKRMMALVGIAAVAASIVAFLVMREWLSIFAYRINMGIVQFAAAALGVAALAFLTISAQSLRAARRNPTVALRYE